MISSLERAREYINRAENLSNYPHYVMADETLFMRGAMIFMIQEIKAMQVRISKLENS
jgi:hypothetical protein